MPFPADRTAFSPASDIRRKSGGCNPPAPGPPVPSASSFPRRPSARANRRRPRSALRATSRWTSMTSSRCASGRNRPQSGGPTIRIEAAGAARRNAVENRREVGTVLPFGPLRAVGFVGAVGENYQRRIPRRQPLPTTPLRSNRASMLACAPLIPSVSNVMPCGLSRAQPNKRTGAVFERSQ